MDEAIAAPAGDAAARDVLNRCPPLGGHPELGFANTVGERRPNRTDGLPDRPTVLRRARLGGPEDAARAAAEATGRMPPERAGDGFAWTWPKADAVVRDRPRWKVPGRPSGYSYPGIGSGYGAATGAVAGAIRRSAATARVKAHDRRTRRAPAAAAGDAGRASA